MRREGVLRARKRSSERMAIAFVRRMDTVFGGWINFLFFWDGRGGGGRRLIGSLGKLMGDGTVD